MQREDRKRKLAWPYERQENALITGLANGEGLPAGYEMTQGRDRGIQCTGFEG